MSRSGIHKRNHPMPTAQPNNADQDNGNVHDLGDPLSDNDAAGIEASFSDDPDMHFASHESIEVPDEVADLMESLEKERDEAINARTRALADYANFQKRASENETRARKDGQSMVVRDLLPALDHFDLAFNQDADTITAEQLLDGMKIVKDELIKVLNTYGVTKIHPKVGEVFDPVRHEAMMRQEAEGVEPNHVVAVYQSGFAIGERVIRPAKVAVAPEEE